MGYADPRKGRYSAPGYEYLVTTVCARRRPSSMTMALPAG